MASYLSSPSIQLTLQVSTVSNRSRTRKLSGSTGSITRITSSPDVVTYTQNLTVETVNDVVAPGNGHYFSVDRHYYKDKELPRFNGTYVYSLRTIEAKNFPVALLREPDSAQANFHNNHITVGGSPTLNQAAAEIVAMTNPSRPLVDYTVFFAELAELPQLFFERSKHLGKDISKGRLSLEYGWKPLIGDIVKLLEFKLEFAKRVKEINALRQSGLRRKRIVFNGSSIPSTYDHDYLLASHFGAKAAGRSTKVTTEKVTGWVKWVPDQEIPRHLGIQNDLAEQKAIFALLGIAPTVIDASTIWELIPFSWLADWCTNAGDYLAAHRNIVGAHPEEILIMRHKVTEHKISVLPTGTELERQIFASTLVGPKDVTRIHETKTREPASLELSAHMPFLSERQVMILADIVRGQGGKFFRK